MMTLQDVIDAAVTCPERYGRGLFFNGQNEPICPLAKEVLGFGFREGKDGQPEKVAAELLGCSRDDVWDFAYWWDARISNPMMSEMRAEKLRARGYRLP